MIAAGFGFRKAATATSLIDAYTKARGTVSADVVATLADKADTPVFQDMASHLGLTVCAISGDQAAMQTTQTNSEASRDARGTGSVAEAAALAAAGHGARLLAPRQISEDTMATCALAISEAP